MSSTDKTEKLKLSQFAATDEPKWLTDYNGDMQKIDACLGRMKRTTTVVVGLESSGYTENDADILIPGNADCTTYLQQAIDRLQSPGGEIKLLEGTYNLEGSAIGENSGKNTKITGSGIGITILNFTRNTPNNGWVAFWTCENKTFTLQDMSINIPVAGNLINGFSGSTIYLCNLDTKGQVLYAPLNDFKMYCTNLCYEKIGDRNAQNWRNIYMNGVAEYVARDSAVRILGTTNEQEIADGYLAGDEVTIRGLVSDTGSYHYRGDHLLYTRIMCEFFQQNYGYFCIVVNTVGDKLYARGQDGSGSFRSSESAPTNVGSIIYRRYLR